jgi:hypothetical protein
VVAVDLVAVLDLVTMRDLVAEDRHSLLTAVLVRLTNSYPCAPS